MILTFSNWNDDDDDDDNVAAVVDELPMRWLVRWQGVTTTKREIRSRRGDDNGNGDASEGVATTAVKKTILTRPILFLEGR